MKSQHLSQQHVLGLLQIAEAICAQSPGALPPGASDQLHYINLAIASLLANMNPVFPGYDKVCLQ